MIDIDRYSQAHIIGRYAIAKSERLTQQAKDASDPEITINFVRAATQTMKEAVNQMDQLLEIRKPQ